MKLSKQQTIYIAPKSTHESRRITTPEPIRGHSKSETSFQSYYQYTVWAKNVAHFSAHLWNH